MPTVSLLLIKSVDSFEGFHWLWLHQLVSELVMDQLVEEPFASIEALLEVDRSSIGGRLCVSSIDHQREAIETDSQITKLRKFSEMEEEMPPRRTNPRRVEQMMKHLVVNQLHVVLLFVL